MSESRTYSMSEGMFVGLLGYAAVVLVVATLDLALGRPLFHTPGMLGRGLVADPGPLGTISPGAVLAYNGVHLLAFLLIGVGVTQVARFVELHPAFWFLAFFACLFAFFAAVLTITAVDPRGEAVPWWGVMGATAVAAVVMGSFIGRRHRTLWQRIREEPEAD